VRAQLMKWGNSVAVRLPKVMLEAAKLKASDQVELESQAPGGILVRAKRRRPDIDELCSRITPENLHPETDTGPPVGKEVW
jgi:antitoxin MazE